MKKLLCLILFLSGIFLSEARAEIIEQPNFNISFFAPDTTGWQIKFNDSTIRTSYMFADQLTVDQNPIKTVALMIMPSLAEAPTLDALKDEWEKGFLKNASKKLFSDTIQVDGIPAHRVAGQSVINGRSGELMGVVVIYNGRNYNFSIFILGTGVKDDPDFKAFLSSVKFKK